LGDLTKAISRAHRNLFPIVDEEGYLKGMVKMDDVRHLIFRQELYDKLHVSHLMYLPEHFISTEDSMEQVIEKFESSGRYNLAVIDKGKYIGFISRARVFSNYRKTMAHFSHD
jgi:CIC family chloride channel protein